MINALKILDGLAYECVKGTLDQPISGLYYDSRKVSPGGLFVAVKGFDVDGHAFVDKAIQNGAKIVVAERVDPRWPDVTVIRVEDSRLALALLSANYFRKPTEKLNLIGLTGTNGKTSISFYIQSILKKSGHSVGVIGTMGVWINDRHIPTHNTTPESYDVQRICAEMVLEGVTHCVMEASSHALELNRVAACAFNTGVFTNLTPDHLELHHTMANYFEAKAKLFQMTSHKNIINHDDPYGQMLLKRHPEQTLTYGLTAESDVFATDIEASFSGSTWTLKSPVGAIRVHTHQPGQIYVYNALGAAAWAISEGFSLQTIKEGIEAVEAIKGRFETVYQDEDKCVIVDFAHTEDGLMNALKALKPFAKGRLLLVFGVYAAPLEEGLPKRIAMGKVAAQYADYSVVTSDNPKKQDPEAIIADIAKAMTQAKGDFTTCVDRKEAICMALDLMQAGDVLLIAGKGHETAQVIGGIEMPFNEKEIVASHMAQRTVSDKGE